jgi:hypothetical protein
MDQRLCRSLAGIAFAIILVSPAAKAMQTPQAIAVSQGKPNQITLRDLPQASAGESTQLPAAAITAPLHGVSTSEYLRMKAEAASSGAAVTPGTAAAVGVPAAPSGEIRTPTTGTAFLGIGYGCGRAYPPDMALAVGPTAVLQVVNSCIGVFSKSGAIAAGFPKHLNAFLGLGASAFPFDPRALYDWVNNRYIVSAVRFDDAKKLSILYVAVSRSSDPSGGWNVYRFNMVGQLILGLNELADFPTLGQDRRGIYVSFNDFTNYPGNPTFAGSVLMLLPKHKMYAGASFQYWFLKGGSLATLDSIQPANVMSKGDNPRAEFMLSSENFSNGLCGSGCNKLYVIAVSNPLYVNKSAPPYEISIFPITITNTFFMPPSAQQPGCSSGNCVIDTGDPRISGEVTYASGSLYGALTTNGTGAGAGEAHFLWFQIKPFLNDNAPGCTGAFNDKCPQIIGAEEVNEVCYGCTSGFADSLSDYYPTVQPDLEGNVTVMYNFSGASEYPSVGYSSNRVTQLPGDMHDPGYTLQSGLAEYQRLDSNGFNRWGDYTATAIDLSPAKQPSFWFAGESSKSTDRWRTAIGRNLYKNVQQP